MAEIDLTPTEEMAANAARGLELRRKHGKGGTEIGVARARDISNRKNLSPETVRRMHAFFSRHEKNKAGGEDDAGYIAWLLWGGDSGQSWAKRKVEQMDKGENQRSDTYKEIAQRLGSAAKFAITKEQIRGASREELRSIEQRLQALAKSGDKNAAALLDYVEEEYNDRYRGTHSRPGAKAKMGMRDTKGRGPFTLQYIASGLYGEPTWLLVDKANKVVAKEHNEQSAKEMLRKANAGEPVYVSSRSGAKAKMAVEAGWRVSPDAKSSGLTVTELLPKLAKGHTFYANLKSGGTVSGTLKAFSTSGVKIDKYGDVTDLRWSDIASIGAGNIGTGPYPIRASRPGAKAKMAANEVDLWNYLSKSDVVLARQNATDLATLKRYAQMALTKPDFTPPSRAQHGPSLHAMAKDTLADIRAWEESVQRHRNRMSRPGAKAKMGRGQVISVVQQFLAGVPAGATKDALQKALIDYADNSAAERRMQAEGNKADARRFNHEVGRANEVAVASWLRLGGSAKMADLRQVLQTLGTMPFSRPGAKAKMAAFEGSYAEIRVRYEFPDGTTDMETMSGPARSAAASAIRRITAKGNGAKAWVIGMRPADPRGRFPAGQVEIWKGEVVDGRAYERGGSFSRPGAKVANAVREGEKVSASDDAVSRKIRKLMDEGKPQKQAVAIALDLERRGEL